MAHYAEGTYPATVVGQCFDDGKFGMQFLIELEIDDNTGSKRTAYMSLTNDKGDRHKNAHKTIAVIRHLGFSGSETSMARLDPSHANHFSFVGARCDLFCSHYTNDAGDAKVNWYINTPRAGMERTPPQKNALRKLDSLFGKELKEPAAEGTQAPQTQPPSSDRPPDNVPNDSDLASGEDLPF